MRAPAWATALVMVGLVLAGCEKEPPGILELGEPLSMAAEWLGVYPEVPSDHPHLPRAREVFAEMREAVGVHADLLVLEMGRPPRARALPDESVLLSRSGLELCYQGVAEDVGDARLAFLLGHELTHVANDDFWHASAFASLQDADDRDEELARLEELLAQDGRDRQVLELRADDAGILAMIAAGYDPKPILEGDRSFFEEWTGGVEGSLAYGDPSHPTAADRATFLQRRLNEVTAQIEPLFQRGVQAFAEAEALAAQDGGRELLPPIEAKYEEAIELFNRFRQHFDGREVLSNLALGHLRLAAAELAACDGILVTRWYLPTSLDRVTLLARVRLRGPGDHSSPCFEIEDYQDHIAEATRLLEQAVEQDAEYLAARLNLIAAFVLDEQTAQAADLAWETAERFPDEPRVATAWSGALLANLQAGTRFLDEGQVLARIDEYRREFPDEPGIAFNLAAFETYQGRLDEALPVWRAFLELEPDGPWAAIARERIGDDEIEADFLARN